MTDLATVIFDSVFYAVLFLLMLGAIIAAGAAISIRRSERRNG